MGQITDTTGVAVYNNPEGNTDGLRVYFSVDDADASADKAQQLGGAIMRPPSDIPDVGRFAVIRDPQGAAFGIIKNVQPPA